MKAWKVVGVDRESGKPREHVSYLHNREAAIDEASAGGIMVDDAATRMVDMDTLTRDRARASKLGPATPEQVAAARPPPPPPVPSSAPAYFGLQVTAGVLILLAGLSIFMALVAFAEAVTQHTISTDTSVMLREQARMAAAGARATMWGMFAVWGLPAGFACLALRDIARNSFHTRR